VHFTNEQNPLSAARSWSLELDLTTAAPDVSSDASGLAFDAVQQRITAVVARTCALHIYDRSGKRIRERSLRQGTSTMSTSDLPPGQYQLALLPGSERLTIVIAR
jgi:hypothetical protein